MANDYTDGLALRSMKMIFDYLPKAYENGSDAEARQKVHNASTMAGMAFANAFLGINHSMAHKLGHTVIAEGVEHERQLQYLRENNCDRVQGYLISKPLDAQDALSLLDNYPFNI